MGDIHMHDHSAAAPRVPIARTPQRILFAALLVAAIATVVGLLVLWPHGEAAGITRGAPAAAKGVTYPTAQVLEVTPGCPHYEPSSTSHTTDTTACYRARVKIQNGRQAGRVTTVALQGPFAASGIRAGDTVELMNTPAQPGDNGTTAAADGGIDPNNSVYGVVRTMPVVVWLLVFVAVVIAVGRRRGALALVSLGVAAGAIVWFVLPALLHGSSGTAVAVVGASAIMFVILYLTHGPSVRTSAALAGTLAGILITAAVAGAAVSTTRLSGMGDEQSGFLASSAPHLSFPGLLTCAIIIAGLGVLNDITISQASTVWELRAAGPGLTRRELFTRGMRVGRDHIASAIYTIMFAYAGAALSVLLLMYIYNQPISTLLGYEDIGAEVVRSLCSAIGLVLAMPVTTAIAAALLPAHHPVHDAPGSRRAARSRLVRA